MSFSIARIHERCTKYKVDECTKYRDGYNRNPLTSASIQIRRTNFASVHTIRVYKITGFTVLLSRDGKNHDFSHKNQIMIFMIFK